MRNSKGEPTPEGVEALSVITPIIEEVIGYLIDMDMHSEEILGVISGVAASSLVSQKIKRRNIKP